MKNQADPKCFEVAGDLLLQWDTENRSHKVSDSSEPNPTIPGAKGTSPSPTPPPNSESSRSNNLSPPPDTRYGPPAENPLPQVIIQRKPQNKTAGKGKSKAAPAIAARPVRAAAVAAAKEQERRVEEERRVEQERRVEEEDSSDSEGDSRPRRQRRVAARVPRKAAPTQKPKAEHKRRVAVPTAERHNPPCGSCKRGGYKCIKEVAGGACVNCVDSKRRCDYSRRWMSRKKKVAGSEVDEVSANDI